MGVDTAVKVEATVLEERPNGCLCAWRWKTERKVLAHLVGAVKRNFVRLVPGDRVEVELAPRRSDARQDYEEDMSRDERG